MNLNTMVLFVYRNVSLPTFMSSLNLVTSGSPWRFLVEPGDALISRARSIAASNWLTNYHKDDVLVMCDDDFSFTPEGVSALADTARETKGIAAGVTPLRSGEFTAIVPLDDSVKEMWLRPTDPVIEIKWAGGLIAYHRSVFEKLATMMPYLHEKDNIPPFWPFFAPTVFEKEDGRKVYLSEDYACHERARQAGFKIYVQPKCQVGHLGEALVTTQNMSKMKSFYEI